MKPRCKGNCAKAHQTIIETSLIHAIDDFLGSLETSVVDSILISQFYNYIKMKFCIPCETGMLFVEKITMQSMFENFKIKSSSLNTLINRKIELYQWIQPRHLEIKLLDFSKAISILKRIESSNIPSGKIFYLMNFIRRLYEKIGKDTCLDGFFPYLVYCLIKSNIRDLYFHVQFLNTFRRKYDEVCTKDCTHGFKICIECDCLVSQNWSSEEDYYITTVIAALDYIAKLEFYNLTIDRIEFDREISKSLRKIENKEDPKNDNMCS